VHHNEAGAGALTFERYEDVYDVRGHLGDSVVPECCGTSDEAVGPGEQQRCY
jgi:hypothetical protein